MRIGDEVTIKQRKRWFYNVPASVELYADPEYLQEVILPAAKGVIDSIEAADTGYDVVVMVRTPDGEEFHYVTTEEIE